MAHRYQVMLVHPDGSLAGYLPNRYSKHADAARALRESRRVGTVIDERGRATKRQPKEQAANEPGPKVVRGRRAR